MGADLYESYVGSILATFALSAAANYGWSGMLLPVALAVCGIVCSLIGSFLIKTKEDATQMSLLKSCAPAPTRLLPSPLCSPCPCPTSFSDPSSTAGAFTSPSSAASSAAAPSATSPSTTPLTTTSPRSSWLHLRDRLRHVIIGGISLGLRSTAASILVVGAAVIISFFCAGGSASFNQGLYGIGIAGVGMLSTLASPSPPTPMAPWPITPAASRDGRPAEEVRDRTDALDSLGNTTAATGKGFAIGSASLTALALLVSYVNIVQTRTSEVLDFTLTKPSVLVGMFVGAMLTFVFSALTMSAVQKAAESIVVEVRRQFREIVGIMDYKADPDTRPASACAPRRSA